MSLIKILIEQRGSSGSTNSSSSTISPRNNSSSQQNKPTKETPTQTSTDKKVDPRWKELEYYLSVIRFFSPNGSRINLRLTTELYNKVLIHFKGLKNSGENFTLLQALIDFLIEGESEKYNVSSFDAPQGYQSQIEMLIQENIITLTSGLKNILLEQAKRVGYVVKSGKIQKQTPKSADGPSTSGPPSGPVYTPKNATPPVTSDVPKETPNEPDFGRELTSKKPEGGEKNTKSEFANNINVKNILTYSNTIDLTGEPDKETCVDLIDIYSKNVPVISQAIKVNNMTPVDANDPTLIGIKKAVEWCIAKHRFTFRTKISDMNRINNLEEPFKINKNILNK